MKRRRRRRRNPGRHMHRHRRHRRPHGYRRRHHRRRRNPGMGGGIGAMVKRTISNTVPAVIGGGVMAVIDNKLLSTFSPLVRTIGKLGVAAVAGRVLRKRPAAAYLTMGAMLGTIGYEWGTRFLGGVVAASKPQGMRQLAMLIREDPAAMSALVTSQGIQTLPSLSGTELPADTDFSQLSLG